MSAKIYLACKMRQTQLNLTDFCLSTGLFCLLVSTTSGSRSAHVTPIIVVKVTISTELAKLWFGYAIRVLHLVPSWTLPFTSCYRSKGVRRYSLGKRSTRRGRRRRLMGSLGKRRSLVSSLGKRRRLVVALGRRRRLMVSTL